MTYHSRLILVRHGAVASPWPSRIYGRLDVPLSEAGCLEAERIVAALEGIRLDAVLSSGLSRAEYTATRLREPRGLPLETDERLLELDRGSWAGRLKAEIAAQEPARWSVSRAAGGALGPVDGESPEAILARVLEGLNATATRWPCGQVAVIAHLWVLRSSLVHALGLGADQLALTVIPTGGVVVLDWPTDQGRSNGARPRILGVGCDRLPHTIAHS